MNITTTINNEFLDADCQFLLDNLEGYNSKFIDRTLEHFKIVVHSGNGEIIGGAFGHSKWGLLNLEIFWVKEEIRGKGVGTKVIEELKSVAKKLNCNGIELYTMSFQAEKFYLSLGFETVGKIDDCWSGHNKIFMYKKL